MPATFATDPSMTPTPDRLIPELTHLIRSAGDEIMRVYATDFDVRGKSDDSPVTAADERAEAIILAGLRRLAPEVPIVAEESVAAGDTPDVGREFWLVDPLDGTREFVRRNGEFTVNIALIQDGQPVLGLVLAPALDTLYTGATGAGAFITDAEGVRPIRCRTPPAEGVTVVTSRSHAKGAPLDAFLAGQRLHAHLHAGSSLKLCLVASGRADLYPRPGRTMEWDIAAGHAVVAAAGGQVRRMDDGQILGYGKPGFENPDFVVSGTPNQ